MLAEGRKLPVPATPAADELKNPMCWNSWGFRTWRHFTNQRSNERSLLIYSAFCWSWETALLLSHGRSHIRIGEQDRYIDLVFYHCRLKFYLLIDLKVGELTHADVGQMDGYVRMFDGLFAAPDDNPSIGLILCTEKMRPLRDTPF